MKRKRKQANQLLFFLSATIVLISFGACLKSKDNLILPTEEAVSVTFSLKLPGSHMGIKTYAISGDEVQEVDVLVFTVDDDGEKFSYHSIGKDIQIGDNPGKIDFTASLRRDENISNEYRLVVLLNVRQELNAYGINIGQTKTYFENNFIHTKEIPTDNWDGPLPMWGESDIITGVGSSTEITGIDLLRSMAGVDVINEADANFTLTEVIVFNSKKKGLIIPNSDSPSLPSFTAGDNETLEYNTVPLTPNELKNEIYLFEAAAGSESNPEDPDPNATALVIGGKFTSGPPDPDVTYYYRIDFRNDLGELMPLLRNNRYVINIKTANYDNGQDHFETPMEAFQERSLTPTAIAYKTNNRHNFVPIGRPSNRGRPAMREEIVPQGGSAIKYTITTTTSGENQ